jgi:hypothetical protein
VEDLASTTAAFTGGGVGIAETSFVDPGHFEFEVTGAAGGIAYSSRDAVMRGRGRAFSAEAWSEVAQVAPAASPFDQWLAGITASVTDQENLRAAYTLTRYVVACNLSAATGEAVPY